MKLLPSYVKISGMKWTVSKIGYPHYLLQILNAVTLLGGGQGGALRTLGKSMPRAGSHSVWEGSLHGDSRGVTARGGEVG